MAASPVLAADLPARVPAKAPPMLSPTPVAKWTGLYAGLHAGYGWGTTEWSQPATGITTGDMRVKGAVAGGQIGYNFQIQNVVAGIETDVAWSGIKGTNAGVFCAAACETKNTWLGTTRARIGVPMGTTDSWLPYITGGLAYGEISVSDTSAGATITRRKTQVGWTAGAGVEYMLASAWSVRLEYLYVDLGKFTTIGDGTAPPFDVKYRNSIVRAGANFHF